MKELFEKYGISQELSADLQLAALEKEKQRLLRKLNHVFGNPVKEEELNREMELLENTMEEIKQSGGTLSLDNITVQTREFSQREMDAGEARKKRIQEMEQRILAEDPDVLEIVHELYEISTYYLSKRDLEKYESWLYYGARKGLSDFMNYLYKLYSDEKFGVCDQQKAYYWMKKGAEHGEKDCCEAFGDYYASPENELFDPKCAVGFFVKAADENHPEAYKKACLMFCYLEEYKKAEICLEAAEKLGLSDMGELRAILENVKRRQ